MIALSMQPAEQSTACTVLGLRRASKLTDSSETRQTSRSELFATARDLRRKWARILRKWNPGVVISMKHRTAYSCP